MVYERKHDRHPDAKSANQSGHDLDSYTHPEGHPDRRLVRRIEVKGRGRQWNFEEAVEMSDTQVKDALLMKAPDNVERTKDFDYWLYIVETDENRNLNVLPIRNIAIRTARFSFSGGSWRGLVEQEKDSEPDRSPP